MRLHVMAYYKLRAARLQQADLHNFLPYTTVTLLVRNDEQSLAIVLRNRTGAVVNRVVYFRIRTASVLGVRAMRQLSIFLLVFLLLGFVCCSCSSSKDSSSPILPSLKADFDAAPRTGDPPLEVYFTNRSTGNITSYFWNFGDGNTSSEVNPVHTYTVDGVYTVTLAVNGPGGSDTESKLSYIICGTPPGPTVDFDADPKTGDSPLTVQFTDLTAGVNVNTWSWDFGDGGTSTEQSPEYTFNTPGTYDVTLAATDDNGTDSETKVAFITVTSGGGGGPLTTFTDLGSVYSGQAVNDMRVFAGKLFIATSVDPLGSFGCALTTYDGSSFDTVLSSPASQGLLRIREIDGKLLVPDGDPNGLIPGYVYISDSTGMNWGSTTVSTGAHLFDVIKRNGLIYLSGQDGAPGIGSLWSSSNGGASFSLVGPRGNGRHKYMVEYNGYVFLSLESTGHAALNASTMTTTSSPIASNFYAWRWRVINGVLYAGGGLIGTPNATPLRYDGGTPAAPAGFDYNIIWDFCEFGGKIYSLAVDGLYESTNNGVSFTKIIEAPIYSGTDTVFWMLPSGGGWNQDAIGALAVYNGNLYAGAIRNGHLYLVE